MLFYRPFIASTDHLYGLQVICRVLQTIHIVYRSILLLVGHSYCFTIHPKRLQILPTVCMSSVPFYRSSIAIINCSYQLQVTLIVLQSIHSFTDHSYCFNVIRAVLQTIDSLYRPFLPFRGNLYHFTSHS